VRDDDGALRNFRFGIKTEKAVPVLLLQPFGLADHECGQDVVRPALFLVVVLRNRAERQKKKNKKPAEAGFLSLRESARQR
jgi:hypothetical protein